jgi:hypothetical protein
MMSRRELGFVGITKAETQTMHIANAFFEFGITVHQQV